VPVDLVRERPQVAAICDLDPNLPMLQLTAKGGYLDPMLRA